jgi:hypothetical protein
MNRKLILAVLGLSMFAAAAPKSYDVILTKPVQAGSTQLAKGEYHVVVDGGHAIFTPVHTKNAIAVPATVETKDKKFSDNVFDITTEGNTARLKSLALGGSKTKLEFGK